MRIVLENIKNILVIRNDRFGEFLLNIPALRALKETFVNAKIIIVVDPAVRELAENVPYLDEIMEWQKWDHPWKEKLGLFRLLSKRRIDIAVMLNPSREFNILTWLLGIPVRVGYDRKCGFFLTHKIKDKKYLGERHEKEYNLELVGTIGAKTQDQGLFLKVEEGLCKQVLAAFNLREAENLVALHPWASDPLKEWPIESFKVLAERLIKELRLTLVLLGGKEEEERSKADFSGFKINFINLVGKTNLLELGAILKKCKLLISCDSGPVHLSSCVDTPALVIFRNDLPGKTAKRWGPLARFSAVIEKNSLSEITVDEVFFKTRRMLER